MQRNCIKCGHTNDNATGDGLEECPACGAIYSRTMRPRLPAAPKRSAAPQQQLVWRGSARLCILLGLGCLLAGAYLLNDPTIAVQGNAGIGTEKVANIHMMTLGETLSIVGAIFLAAGIRPR